MIVIIKVVYFSVSSNPISHSVQIFAGQDPQFIMAEEKMFFAGKALHKRIEPYKIELNELLKS